MEPGANMSTPQPAHNRSDPLGVREGDRAALRHETPGRGEPEERTVEHPNQALAADAQENRPDALMVFDGLCNACSAQVRLLLRLDRAGTIRFTSIQSPYGRHLAARFGIDADDPSTFLFFDGGRPLTQSQAVIAIAGRLPRPWRWLRVLAYLPRPVRDGAYRWVARNRYRLAGRRETCMIPSPEVRARFIDTVPQGNEPPPGARA